jgi:hypothetical protein
MDTDIGKELNNIMDALAALKIDLDCDPNAPGETLVLSANKARDACEALESASASIRQLVAALDERETGRLGR